MYNSVRSKLRVIDRKIIISLLILFGFGIMLVAAGSPSVAARIGLPADYFSSRQLMYISTAIVIIAFFAYIDKKHIARLSILGFLSGIIMLIAVRFYGYEVKGAIRWISIAGMSLQPSEIIKPFFSVVIGRLASLRGDGDFPAFRVCLALYFPLAFLLIIQPDFGMLIMITTVFALQLFVAGLHIIWFVLAAVPGIIGVVYAYFLLPHVRTRINNFLDPANNENYQVSKSIAAFEHGGMYGTGPGEGVVKKHLPDSHTDFIFAVAGEEFGAIICLIIIASFAFIVFRSLFKLFKENDNFVRIASVGIICQFGLQVIFNIGVTLNLFPTKGMTLPFISYGGSSMIANSLAIGILLGLNKKNVTPRYAVKARFRDGNI